MNVEGKENRGLLQLDVNNKVKYGSFLITVQALQGKRRERNNRMQQLDNNAICCIVAHEGHLSPDSTACHFSSLQFLHSLSCEVSCSNCQAKGRQLNAFSVKPFFSGVGVTLTSSQLAVCTVRGLSQVLHMYVHDVGKWCRTVNSCRISGCLWRLCHPLQIFTGPGLT